MPTTIDELLKTQERIALRRAEVAAQLKALDADIEAIRHVVRLLDANHPAVRPPRARAQSPKRDVQVVFRHNECPQLVLATLRDADKPLDIRTITAAVLDAKGVDTTGLRLTSASRRISHVIQKLHSKSRVQRFETEGGLRFAIQR